MGNLGRLNRLSWLLVAASMAIPASAGDLDPRSGAEISAPANFHPNISLSDMKAATVRLDFEPSAIRQGFRQGWWPMAVTPDGALRNKIKEATGGELKTLWRPDDCKECTPDIRYIVQLSFPTSDLYRLKMTVTAGGQSGVWTLDRPLMALNGFDHPYGQDNLMRKTGISIGYDVALLGAEACAVLAHSPCRNPMAQRDPMIPAPDDVGAHARLTEPENFLPVVEASDIETVYATAAVDLRRFRGVISARMIQLAAAEPIKRRLEELTGRTPPIGAAGNCVGTPTQICLRFDQPTLDSYRLTLTLGAGGETGTWKIVRPFSDLNTADGAVRPDDDLEQAVIDSVWLDADDLGRRACEALLSGPCPSSVDFSSRADRTNLTGPQFDKPADFAPHINADEITNIHLASEIDPAFFRDETADFLYENMHSLPASHLRYSLPKGRQNDVDLDYWSKICDDCASDVGFIIALSKPTSDSYRLSLTVQTGGETGIWSVERPFSALNLTANRIGPRPEPAREIAESIMRDAYSFSMDACARILRTTCTHRSKYYDEPEEPHVESQAPQPPPDHVTIVRPDNFPGIETAKISRVCTLDSDPIVIRRGRHGVGVLRALASVPVTALYRKLRTDEEAPFAVDYAQFDVGCGGDIAYSVALSQPSDDSYRLELRVAAGREVRTWSVVRPFSQLNERPGGRRHGESFVSYVNESALRDLDDFARDACARIAGSECASAIDD